MSLLEKMDEKSNEIDKIMDAFFIDEEVTCKMVRRYIKRIEDSNGQ